MQPLSLHAAVHPDPSAVEPQEVAVCGGPIKSPGSTHAVACLKDGDTVTFSQEFTGHGQATRSSTNDSLHGGRQMHAMSRQKLRLGLGLPACQASGHFITSGGNCAVNTWALWA